MTNNEISSLSDRLARVETKGELIAQESSRRFDSVDDKFDKLNALMSSFIEKADEKSVKQSNIMISFIEKADEKYAKQSDMKSLQDRIWTAVSTTVTILGTVIISLIVYIWNLAKK